MAYAFLSDVVSQFAMLDDTAAKKSDIVNQIERGLCISLPFDFSRICEFLEGSGLATGSLTGASDEGEGVTVIALTQMFRRELGLPNRYVVLAATDEDALLLTGVDATGDSGVVHSIPRSELAMFTLGIPPANARCWPTFVDYVATVLEHEEA